MFSAILFTAKKKRINLKEILNNVLNCEQLDGVIRVVLQENIAEIKAIVEQKLDPRLRVIINEGNKLAAIKKVVTDLSTDSENIIMISAEQVMNNNQLLHQLIEEYIAKEVELLVSKSEGQKDYPLIVNCGLIAGLESITELKELPIFFTNQASQICYYPVENSSTSVGPASLGRLNYKFWLEDQDKIFGDGPCDILLRIDKYGSLRKAALDIDMSYSQAWNLIKNLETKLGFQLIERRVGGASGGGSKLTRKGRILMNNFNSFRQEVKKELARLEKKYFNQELWDKLK